MASPYRVEVEPGGTFLRGLGVPFREPALVLDSGGNVVAEEFDELSLSLGALPVHAPLLLGHDRTRPPAGIIRSARVERAGLVIEAELTGSDDELEGLRRRFASGAYTGLSVGFASQGKQEYRAPARRGAPPRLLRRGVEVAEVSLVVWPAYETARVHSVRVRTAEAHANHEATRDMQSYVATHRPALRDLQAWHKARTRTGAS